MEKHTDTAIIAPMDPSGDRNQSTAAATAVDTSFPKTVSHSTAAAELQTQQPSDSSKAPPDKQKLIQDNSALKAELSSVQARIFELNKTLHNLQHSLHQQQQPKATAGEFESSNCGGEECFDNTRVLYVLLCCICEGGSPS